MFKQKQKLISKATKKKNTHTRNYPKFICCCRCCKKKKEKLFPFSVFSIQCKWCRSFTIFCSMVFQCPFIVWNWFDSVWHHFEFIYFSFYFVIHCSFFHNFRKTKNKTQFEIFISIGFFIYYFNSFIIYSGFFFFFEISCT